MNIDVGFWLTLLLFVCVLVWLLDRAFKIRKKETHPLKGSVEFVISLLPVFFIVLVVRSFMVEPFTIPSGSMIPTLEVHDFIAVEKYAYGLKLPVTGTKVMGVGEPKRGDVMVFRYPDDTNVHFIKRVIGLPGDHIKMQGGALFINGKQVEQAALRTWVEAGLHYETRRENLDGRWHTIQHVAALNPFTGVPDWHHFEGEWTVPDQAYFVLGDNRDRSNDSRYWGMVPEKLVEGRAFVIWMHLDGDFPWINFSRNGKLDKTEQG